jgi:hypothetical protein
MRKQVWRISHASNCETHERADQLLYLRWRKNALAQRQQGADEV